MVSECGSVGRALRLGRRGPRFESGHSDKQFMVEIEFENLIPCVPLERSEYCGQAAFQYALMAINVTCLESQEELRKFVSDRLWGTQPHEEVNMASTYLPQSHILAKTDWSIKDLEEILDSPDAVAVINIHDNFVRIAKEGHISEEPPDGHYLDVWTFLEFDGKKYAVVIDSSTEKIMEGHNGVLHTKYEGVYLIPTIYLESIWHDTLKNGEKNMRWGMILISPNANASILDKYRNQGKLN